jgi:DNA-binding NarL/FixJ family response regulator
MLGLNHIKITPRDEQVLQLLVQGCSNKEITAQLNISPRTVKQHLRTLFLRAGIPDGKKTSQAGNRYIRKGANKIMQPRERLTAKMQVAALVWEGQTNREIAKAIGTTEQVVKNYLRNTFDKLGVWSCLELALYVARHGGGGERWREELTMKPIHIFSGTIAS